MGAGPEQQAQQVAAAILKAAAFDKRSMALPCAQQLLPSKAPQSVDVVVVGAGLLGMYAATRIAQSGLSVVILERRNVVGGIWSMYANSTSQVRFWTRRRSLSHV